ncbi:UPF0687 protein C20orf27 homolog [Biomphalaria glabrata]|uniref:Adipose-secreted signaling protein n=1 Tax=Biomphalaria glabrata TaxID=6526 RepID=A0A9W3ABT5_BIOGL|nr:UPF0687 protein C20orf27 homolog [Biomphalaria glabrata]XP_055884718.1 UPF0687 protein C20orf27 homolog [Biomphalaria glabrata]XP_055884725.1 UPF0687 protein C20orf27 homolog [Biomphalaria glabrata]XP_055884729.1 UPF0687 protein C20orf27 homolog [Biomphalaria glabrata]
MSSMPKNTEDNDHASHSQQQHLHAHFQLPASEDDLNAHDSKILLEPIDDEKFNVRLGFLQYKHVYEVRFNLPDDVGDELTSDPLQNLNVKIESTEPLKEGKGHTIVLTFRAVKEKIMQESITLQSKSDPRKVILLVLHARVLGKGKGTPSLKKGIHCVRIEWDEESDASDCFKCILS